jgi:hypothetical protein
MKKYDQKMTGAKLKACGIEKDSNKESLVESSIYNVTFTVPWRVIKYAEYPPTTSLSGKLSPSKGRKPLCPEQRTMSAHKSLQKRRDRLK